MTMDTRWFWVVMSTLALVGGFSVLLVCINFFAVPHMLTGGFIPTMCTLVSIKVTGANGEQPEQRPVPDKDTRAMGRAYFTTTEEPIIDGGQQKVKQYKDSNLKKAKEVKNVGANFQEATRTVNEAAIEAYQDSSVELKRSGHEAKSHIMGQSGGATNKKVYGRDSTEDILGADSSQRQSALSGYTSSPVDVGTIGIMLTEAPQLMTSPNTCVQLGVTYPGVHGGSVHEADMFDSAWTFYNVNYGEEKCFCPGCVSEDGTVVAVKGQRLVPGDAFPCLYEPVGAGQVIASRNSIGLVLNIMLWPTLVFITGFVGIVFACLYVQRGDWGACPCRNYSY